MASTAFDLDLTERAFLFRLRLPSCPLTAAFLLYNGTTDFTANAAGEFERPATINVNLMAPPAMFRSERGRWAGSFKGTTNNQILNAELVATLENRLQRSNASLNFGNDNLPLRVHTNFDQSPLGPFLALIPQLSGVSVDGTGTGQNRVLAAILRGGIRTGTSNTRPKAFRARRAFSQLKLRLQDMPINAVEPVIVRFDTREIALKVPRFAGSGLEPVHRRNKSAS
jgi:hypothetical protein